MSRTPLTISVSDEVTITIEYEVFQNDGVYFCARTRRPANGAVAAYIVTAIGTNAKIPWQTTSFVDVMTNEGHVEIQPGQYKARRLTFDTKGEVPYSLGYYPHELPEHVQAAFADLIQGPSQQRWERDLLHVDDETLRDWGFQLDEHEVIPPNGWKLTKVSDLIIVYDASGKIRIPQSY